jgi:glycosyltransferase involved in cell wall biosynthesis
MSKISAIIPAFNEAHNIEAAINSVAFADEVMVVDSFSTDETVSLAKKKGARILQRTYENSASQKNWAIPQAKYEWVVLLDADERVELALQKEIRQTVQNPASQYAGFWIYRKNYFLGKRVRYSGWQGDKVIRLFKRNLCRYQNKQVHAEIIAQGTVGTLKHKITHNTFKNIDHYLAKLNRYAHWQAIDYDSKTGRLNPFHFVIKPSFRFFKHYILKLGFLDGLPGFAISYLQAYAVFMRYLKLWEKRQRS